MKLILRTIVIGSFCSVFLFIVALKISHAPLRLRDSGSLDGNEEVLQTAESLVDITSFHNATSAVHLVVVVCGDRLSQALTTIKSALLFVKSELKIHIFAEAELKTELSDQLTDWQRYFPQKWSFEVRDLEFPNESQKEWKNLFKPCAAQRLFLPGVMKDVDSILYVDVDVLFLSPPDVLWNYFKEMNSSQLAALAPESEDAATGWYNRFARHPYYGELGVNSGVMLMNLTRLRKFKWDSYIVPTYQHYKSNITWGDQDIINIIFHYHSDKLYILPCEFNYRPDHCMYMSVCKTAEANGVHVLHGNRGAFVNDKQPAFKAFYDSFSDYDSGKDILSGLMQPLVSKLEAASDTNCGRVQNFLMKNLEHSLV